MVKISNSLELDSGTNLPTTKKKGFYFTEEDINNPIVTYDQRTRNANPYDQMNFTNLYTDPISIYEKYGGPTGRFNNWNEGRAQNQSTGEKWMRGLSKAAVTTIGALAENTLGVIAGLGEVAIGSGYYYDNFVGKAIDKTNEWMRTTLPNYKTIEEQQMSISQKLGTANFWADTVANGLGYSIGSLATMWLTGGTGIIMRGAKTLGMVGKAQKTKALYDVSKAIATGTQLGDKIHKASKAQRLLTSVNVAEVGLMMSLAEASVEARETQKRTFEDLMELEKERSGFVSPEAEKNILEASYSAGNADWFMQLPVLAGSNLLMFGSQLLGFKSFMKLNRDVAWNTASKTAVNNLANRGMLRNFMSRMKPTPRGAAIEASQEGWQFASKVAAMDYHTDKYFNAGSQDMIESLYKGLEETFGTQEGLESMLVGAIVGGGMSGASSIYNKPFAQRQKNAAYLTDLLNGGYLANSSTRMLNSNAAKKALMQMEMARKNGDEAAFTAAQDNLIAANAYDIIQNGGFETFMSKMDDAASMPDEEFAKSFGYDPKQPIKEQTGLTKQEIVDNLKNKYKTFKDVYTQINKAYPQDPIIPGEVGTLSPLYKMRLSKEEREAVNEKEKERARLRSQLILGLFGIKQRNQRMQDYQKEMQDILNTTTNLVNGVPILEGDFSIYNMPDPDAENYNAQQEINNYSTRINEIENKLIAQKADAQKILDFKEKAILYGQLLAQNAVAVDAYNKLNSNKYFQEIFNSEVKQAEAEAKEKAKQNKNKEAIKEAKTKKDLEDNVEDLEGEAKAEAEDKYKDLERSEAESKDDYLRSVADLNIEQGIQNLKNIDTTELTELETAGLVSAIKLLEESLERTSRVEPPAQDLDELLDTKIEDEPHTPRDIDLGDQLDLFEDPTIVQTDDKPLPGVELAIDNSMWTSTQRGVKPKVGVDNNGNVVYNKDITKDEREDGTSIEINIGPLLGDTKGKEVEFEIIETKWFIENHKGKPTENEQIPVYIKADGIYVGKLKANTSEGRLAIIQKLQAGEKVTTKIFDNWSTNNNNAVLSEATSTSHFYKVEDQFGDGNIDNVLLALTTGGSESTDVVQWVVPGGEQKNVENLDTIKGQAQTEQTKGRLNQIGAVALPNNVPGGQARIFILSTANLSPTAQETVLKLIENRDYIGASSIVAASQQTRTSEGRDSSFLQFNSFQNGEKYLVYYSPELQKLLRFTESEMIKGLKGHKAKFTVVNIKDGQYEMEKKYTTTDVDFNLQEDFKTFLSNKKYHVDKELMNSIDEYISPVTGQSYTSYQEYLFSPNEVGERVVGEGHYSILSTDAVKIQQSLFNNPKVTFERGNIMGETKQEIIDSVTFTTEAPAAPADDVGIIEFIEKETFAKTQGFTDWNHVLHSLNKREGKPKFTDMTENRFNSLSNNQIAALASQSASALKAKKILEQQKDTPQSVKDRFNKKNCK